MANGEPITHTLGTGELRIDKPLPPKAAPAAAPRPPPPRRQRQRRCRKNGSADWRNCGWNASKPKPPDSPEEQNDSRHRTARMLVHGIGLGRHRSGRRCAPRPLRPRLLRRLQRRQLAASTRGGPCQAASAARRLSAGRATRPDAGPAALIVVATRDDGVTEDVTAKAQVAAGRPGKLARLEGHTLYPAADGTTTLGRRARRQKVEYAGDREGCGGRPRRSASGST